MSQRMCRFSAALRKVSPTLRKSGLSASVRLNNEFFESADATSSVMASASCCSSFSGEMLLKGSTPKAVIWASGSDVDGDGAEVDDVSARRRRGWVIATT